MQDYVDNQTTNTKSRIIKEHNKILYLCQQLFQQNLWISETREKIWFQTPDEELAWYNPQSTINLLKHH